MEQVVRRQAALGAPARLLFRATLAIFVVTIVIGILNGLDVWEPSHNMLLTHVHAGPLGWITLAVAGSAFLMFGEGMAGDSASGANRLAISLIVVTVFYVIAFATGIGIFRPIAGTLMLIAVIWMLWWTAGRYRATSTTTSRLALVLAMISLTIGAVLGVLLGLFIANGSVPGLNQDQAGALAGAHPPAMLIGYLVLAGAAVTHWVLDGPERRLGPVVAWSLFVSGELDPEAGTGPIGVLLAFDHSMFVGVMSNALFAAVGSEATQSRGLTAVMWGVNAGLAVFLVGLVADVSLLIAIGAPLMGICLLIGIYLLLTGLRSRPVTA